ncbi:MAG: hypothetical protein EU532_12700 [Promethearchaeota archaeon]|nr:MAG: hypothetical protein EU532_12700 [Candidatus Lokiarchaeota archaeon]
MSEQIKNNAIHSDKSEDKTSLSSKIEKLGLNYINKKKSYLFISTLFPICLLIINVSTITYLFILFGVEEEEVWKFMHYIFTKSFDSLFILFFSIFQLIFLISWRKKIKEFNVQRESHSLQLSEDPTEIPERTTSLPRLFYNLVAYMEKHRIIFIVFNFVAFYILFFNFWTFPLFEWLNIFSTLFIIFYLGFQWFHFFKWNKKFSRLRTFEKKVYKELDL